MSGVDPKSFRLAVLLSGAGSTMVNLARHIASGDVPATIEVVVSSRPGVLGLSRAKELGIPTLVHRRRPFLHNKQFDISAYSAALAKLLEPYAPDLVVMAGFMTQLGSPFLDRFPTVNVHPALLPAFGGKGFYGHHVHEAVLAAGVKVSGATVHFASGEYDQGPIIAQEVVPVMEGDTPDTLAARVQEAEREVYPRAVRLIAKGLVSVVDGRTRIRDERRS